MNKRILWITNTAVFIALLIGAQAATASLQAATPVLGQLVTGSLVNLILIIAVMTCGLMSGATVALISPVFAKLFGIGPLWTIIPLIMAGNVVLVLVWHVLGRARFSNTHVVRVFAAITAAVFKFLALYLGIVKLAIPLFLDLPEKAAANMSAMFYTPQLFTALIGGAVAVAILPVVDIMRKNIRRGGAS